MSEVILKNIAKRYPNGFEAIADLNLEIKDREFVVLVGPSGCGKSTTLRMIAGLEEASDGEIYIGDRNVTNVAPKDRDIAMVFQNYALYPHMNVYENMEFGLKLRKLKKDEIKKRVEEAAEILDIKHLLDRKPKDLSGGQRQRVALGRAIVREPQVFLMDEPLSNLDAKLRVQMRAEISKLHERLQTTFIYVTHDQTEAMTMGDRIVVMKDGVIQQNGSPDEIYHHPNNMFVAGFIGSPSMNFIHGEIVDEGGKLYFVSKSIKIKVPSHKSTVLKESGYVGKALVLGIRPQDMRSESEFSEMAYTAEINVIENMGSEKYLYMNMADGTEIVARVEARISPTIHSQITLYLEPEKIHFFDSNSEETIR